MAKDLLNQGNEITNESTISQKNDNLNKEKLNVLSFEDPEKFLSYLISKERWDSNWPDWNTRGSDYGRDPKLITEQVRMCKRLIRNIDSVFQRKPSAKLNKGTVETFCKTAEHNPIVAFLAEAYKKSFSKDGEGYYENWHKNHQNIIPKSKAFRKWMIKSLVEQRVTDGTPGYIDFDHIDEDIESKIYTEIQRCHGF